MTWSLNKVLHVLLLLAVSSFSSASTAQSLKPNEETPTKTYKFINGQWFDGRGFKKRTFYSVKGFLTQVKPPTIDQTIDLKDGYVVPPFGDAHCHYFDAAVSISQQIEMYLRDGIFYAKVQGNRHSGALAVADKVNNPSSVDVSYAHGMLTRTFGHGIEVFETLALRLIPMTSVIEANKEKIAASRLRESDSYYIIDTAEDLDHKWQQIMEKKPDFIKINLLHSESFDEQVRKIPDIKLGHIGLDPRLVPRIVEKAHAAGLRVSAHVETAADYRVALAAGVDEMAHVPGYYFGTDEDPTSYRLSESDVKESVRRKIRVIPTPNLPASFADGVVRERVEAVGKHNLSLLRKHRVQFAFGSDAFGETSVPYVLYLGTLGIFNNLEVLKIWVEDTPKSIFPNRKIGHLKSGYEASFLVLEGNPLIDLGHVKRIRLRFKQGMLINIGENGK